MGKEKIAKKKLALKIISDVVFLLYLFGLFTILVFHKILPFFPILFLFDFSLLIGYPLFLKFVLKKKWFDCTKNDYLLLKYILIPCIILELLVLLYYPHETYLAIQQMAKG